MSELHTAPALLTADLIDSLEIPARKAAATGLTKLTLGQIKSAVKATGVLSLQGGTDLSGNPNYPAALKGDVYYATVAGKIGGGSGKSLDIGDAYIASADNAGGTEAGVGASWFVLEHNLVSALTGSLAVAADILAGTDSAKLATPLAIAALWKKGADIASAATVTFGDGGFFHITGTTAITALACTTDYNGRRIYVEFAGILTLTYNAASLILPTAANITTAAGDTACFVSEGSGNFRCVSYNRASGAALVGSTSLASTTDVLTGTDAAKATTADAVASLWEQGPDVASSGTISVGEGGYFAITGTTGISTVGFATDKAGRKAWFKFAGILTLTHSSNLILPTAANITTAAGDIACFVSEGSGVIRCIAYQRADGTALAGTSTYGDENARDAIGSALVAGSGVTIVVDDPLNTITISASGAGAGSGGLVYPGDGKSPRATNFNTCVASLRGGTTGNALTVTDDSDVGVVFVNNNTSESTAVKIHARSYSAMNSASFFFASNINIPMQRANAQFGICVGNLSSNYWLLVGVLITGGVAKFQVAAENPGWSDGDFTTPWITPLFVRIRNDPASGTPYRGYFVDVSADGKEWFQYTSNAGLGVDLTHYGYYIGRFSDTGQKVPMSVSWMSSTEFANGH